MRALLARYGGYALVVSVALNLFLGGLVAGEWVSDDGAHDRGRISGIRMRFDRQDLSPKSRAIIHDIMAGRAQEMRPRIVAIRQARAEVRERATADPLDPAALAAALKELRLRSTEAQEATHQMLLLFAERLPPDERSKLFAPRPPRRDRDEEHGDDRPRPPPPDRR